MSLFGLERRSRAPRHARRPWILAAAIGLAALAGEGHRVQADESPVVAKVGTRTITAAELERRIANIPPFQLRTFGDTPDQIRRNFLERVLVREALFAQGAEARGLADRDDVKERVRAVLRNAMLAKLRGEVQATAKPTDADVKAYYDKNAAKYHSPPRVALWQIIVAKREEAAEILAELKKDPTPKRWTELAREKSIDKATNLRGGNLGFVMPDGTTSEPGVKVSPEVVKAADAVKDSELVPDPVKVEGQWAVVWRRQSMKAIDRPVELEAGSIRQILLHERTEAKIKETVAALRKDRLGEHAPELLDTIDVSGTGDLVPTRRPGAMPSAKKTPASPTPAPGTQR
jgi:peptidyl-prolyl cis-trans isomerase C